jgi:hypothetical protein
MSNSGVPAGGEDVSHACSCLGSHKDRGGVLVYALPHTISHSLSLQIPLIYPAPVSRCQCLLDVSVPVDVALM